MKRSGPEEILLDSMENSQLEKRRGADSGYVTSCCVDSSSPREWALGPEETSLGLGGGVGRQTNGMIRAWVQPPALH